MQGSVTLSASPQRARDTGPQWESGVEFLARDRYLVSTPYGTQTHLRASWSKGPYCPALLLLRDLGLNPVGSHFGLKRQGSDLSHVVM